jgi:hypothetical protein
MAGDHRSGWGASRTGLVEGARVYVCPPADAPRCIVDLAAEWWSWPRSRWPARAGCCWRSRVCRARWTG